MSPHEIKAGPVRQQLADAIRAVNAAHAEAGSPDLPDLRDAWIALDRTLSLAVVAGDDLAARTAVGGGVAAKPQTGSDRAPTLREKKDQSLRK